jgi:hypothetical protein
LQKNKIPKPEHSFLRTFASTLFCIWMFLGRGNIVLDKLQLFLKGMAFSAPDAIMMF